ncbi:Penicillin-binding protein 1A/1B [compost metagenome]
MNVTKKFLGLVTAREALNKSLNIPALKIFNEEVKIDKAWDFVKKLGITTLQPSDSAAQTGVIGGLSIGVSVEELTNAYGAIPNKGVFNDAYMIERITDADGKVVYEHKLESKRVFSEETAFLMTDMLQTVISGSGASGRKLMSEFDKYGKIPIAGKTGSTQSYGDVWFMGFSPDITLGVWAGYEEQVNSLSEAGKWRARQIWAQIMNEVTDSKPEMFPSKSFERPAGVVKATVSSASGLLPSQLTKSSGMLVTDWFNKKFIPKEIDNALVNMAYITYEGVNYVPNPATPDDMLKEQVVIKRKKPLDVLMDEISQAQSKLPAKSRRSMSIYIPADASKDAPSKTDPRVDDGAAPPPPSIVKLATAENGMLVLSFNDSTAKDVVGYRVYRSVNQGAFEKTGESIPLGEEKKMKFYTAASQSYSFYVTAVDVVGKESAPSQIAKYGEAVKVPDPVVETEPTQPEGGSTNVDQSGASAPAAPTGLEAKKNDLSVRLTWTANTVSEQVTQYHVYYSANSDGKYTKVGTTSESSFEYVAPLITGSFYVTSENSNGESAASSRVTVN